MPQTSSPLHAAIATLAKRQSLTEDETALVFGVVMRGEATHSQIAALLMGLRVKGEDPAEVAGAARAMREAMVQVDTGDAGLIDTCGTGGGIVGTFNISTAAALVAAGAGARVAKHGNRSFTSRCGSADVLEALGVAVTLDAQGAARVLREACVTFLFAPNFHPAMKHVGPVRSELRIPSVMNMLGPLANPAGARRQVIGVADPERAALMAQALARLGTEHAMIVHARVGMDEISPYGVTDVWEIRNGEVVRWEIDAERFDFHVTDVNALQGGAPQENARRIEQLLDAKSAGSDPAGRAAVALNAGAALYVAGLADSYEQGVRLAEEMLSRGAGWQALERLRRASPSTSG